MAPSNGDPRCVASRCFTGRQRALRLYPCGAAALACLSRNRYHYCNAIWHRLLDEPHGRVPFEQQRVLYNSALLFCWQRPAHGEINNHPCKNTSNDKQLLAEVFNTHAVTICTSLIDPKPLA